MPAGSALVLFSGGQDSTVCLAWALERYAHVETVGFAYGQRHAVELTQRPVVRTEIAAHFPRWAPRLGDDHLLALSTLGQISETALTRDVQFEMTAAGLPNTFVPGRNLLFFTYAAALAYRRGIRTLVGGMCETDFSGYPDCRNETLQSLAKSDLARHGRALHNRDAADVDRQGWHLGDGRDTRRPRLGRPHRHPHAHLLHAGPHDTSRLGHGLRQMPGVRPAGERMGKMADRQDMIRAVDLAIAGDWDGAHKIAQQDEADPTSCWIHAVLHKIEGDAGNARYWYRLAGQSYEAFADPKAELAAIKAVLSY